MLGRLQLAAALLAVAVGAPVLAAQEQEQVQVQEQEQVQEQVQVREGKRFVVGVTVNSTAIDPATAASQQVRVQS